MKLYAAPLQGYTEAPWRHYHAMIYGGIHAYYTPFIRVEHGSVRPRDIRDITSELNTNLSIIPQIICKDEAEFHTTTEAAIQSGHKRIDINMGCPFALQVNRGRGAALMLNQSALKDIARAMVRYPEVRFSIKMRLGMNSSHEWQNSIDIINNMPLHSVTIHPRIASQQYSGHLDMEQLHNLASMLTHPVIFNGDVTTISGIKKLSDTPGIDGIMIGRGLLARPSLAIEHSTGTTWNREQRLQALKRFHSCLYNHYRETLCGDSQLLSKTKPFWEYLEPEIGHKAAKMIHKSGTIHKYTEAITYALTQSNSD